ncbi:MAG: hypothetical protein MUQ43_01460 [Reinekea forsetii]|jgi:hypothetical protein|uniref:Uncharacterized protein n=1 Tax=Reinekea forsetii TaxID=1336806 RepID=A0A2K8KU66_9GAMM|nr:MULTISPECIES: DUF6776 family protein [Reinekea]ATX78278.1 hypothetical protein REIFOR_03171 [Reinekea forsetii]MDO7645297.1 hypothetical protein [Reinekea forsetii]MDO7673070.1 hypothetical protein [Reinekea forsetii]
MGQVKGRVLENLVVVPHRPWRRFIYIVLTLLTMAAGVYTSYWYGISQGIGQEKVLYQQRQQLQIELLESIGREDELRQLVAVLENATFVDKESVDGVRQTNRELTDRIAQLEEDVSLYQGIMSPSVNAAGLTIQEVTLVKTASANRYRFKVMLTQVGNNSSYLRGFVGVTIVGVQGDTVTAYPLKDLSIDISDTEIKFRYRYFQDFTGELVLPENFTPDQLQVIAQSVGDKPARLEKAYIWSDLETGNNVGQ